MTGAGEYKSIDDTVNNTVSVTSVVSPSPEIVELYDKKYKVFRNLYPALKDIFHDMRA